MKSFRGRTLDRLQALQALFQAEAAQRGVAAVLEGPYILLDEADQENFVTAGPIRPYARELALGSEAHRERIDAIIAERSLGWDLSRITPVDRNLLRVAIFELLYEDDVNAAVTANEAVLLAKALGGDDSHRFVNGILGAVARGEAALGEGAEPAPERADETSCEE